MRRGGGEDARNEGGAKVCGRVFCRHYSSTAAASRNGGRRITSGAMGCGKDWILSHHPITHAPEGLKPFCPSSRSHPAPIFHAFAILWLPAVSYKWSGAIGCDRLTALTHWILLFLGRLSLNAPTRKKGRWWMQRRRRVIIP